MTTTDPTIVNAAPPVTRGRGGLPTGVGAPPYGGAGGYADGPAGCQPPDVGGDGHPVGCDDGPGPGGGGGGVVMAWRVGAATVAR